jgi:predicted metal-dependent phosphoesterase TrpH
MILDLHTHSVKSDDSRARVESYCQWIRKRDIPVDGFVLTEHRQYDDVSDYRELEDRFGLLILKASEVETDYGHVLVFGVNEDMRAAFDFQAIDLDLRTVLVEAERCGGVAVPCHPGRPRVGLFSHYTERGPVDGVRVVEVLNGGSRGDEDAISREQAQKHGYLGIGGSDSHIVSHIGRCATRFEPEIRAIGDLVQALRGEQFEAVAQR